MYGVLTASCHNDSECLDSYSDNHSPSQVTEKRVTKADRKKQLQAMSTK